MRLPSARRLRYIHFHLCRILSISVTNIIIIIITKKKIMCKRVCREDEFRRLNRRCTLFAYGYLSMAVEIKDHIPTLSTSNRLFVKLAN